MPTTRTTPSVAYDVTSLNKLKYSAKNQADGGKHAAAKQFEAMFLRQMLSSMRKAIPDSHLLGDSSAMKQTRDMMDAQWADTLSERGIGLADMLEKHLGHSRPDSQQSMTTASGHGSADAVAGIPVAQTQVLKASDSLAAIEAQRRAAVQTAFSDSAPLDNTSSPAVIDKSGRASPLLDFSDVASTNTMTQAGTDLPTHVSAFLSRLRDPAMGASRATGLPSQLILAQAALETGWGRHEIQTDAGTPSHNVFNIKATGWDGASTDVATHEFVNGTRQATTDGFRVYDSYDEAFADYARLIDTAPRYAGARAAATPEAAARALQDAGYATDPAYADKLVSVMKHIPMADRPASGLFAERRGGAVVDLDATSGTTLVS